MRQAGAKAEKSAERFFGALGDVFVGAKVEGQSGFINLMRSSFFAGSFIAG